MNRKIKIEIAIGIIILVAGLMGFAIFFSDSSRQEENNGNFSQYQNQGEGKTDDGGQNYVPNCKSNLNPVFSSNFTDLSMLKYIAPIGAINAGSPARSYVFMKDGIKGKAPIFAPADGTLESLVYAKRDSNNKNAPGEYRLDIRISCEMTLYFDHIDDVVDKIKVLAPKEPADNTRDIKWVSLPLKAGELLGYSDGTDQAKGFDFFLINKAKEVAHINSKRWEWDQTRYADCPYDYFTSELQSQIYGIFRSHDGQKLSKFDCGNASHDVAGTASGGWFLGNDSTDTKGHWLEIGNANGKVEVNRRENGWSNFRIRDYSPEIFPEDMKVGNKVCYSEENNWVYISLISESQLLVATGQGSCPASFPESQAMEWNR